MRRTAPVVLLILALSTPARGGGSAEDFQRELARGLVLLEVGQHVEALSALRRAAALAPDRLDLKLRVAALEARLGQDGLAERHLRELLAKDPDATDVLRELGGLLIARGKAAEAEAFLIRAVANSSTDGVALYYLGLAYHAQEKDVQAREALAKVPAIAPALRSQAQYQQGLNVLRAGDTRPARQLLVDAVKSATDEVTVARAKSTLAELDKREAQGGRTWDLTLTLGAAFDSNVSLLPDLAGDLPLPPGTNLVSGGNAVSTAAAARLSTEVAFEGRPLMGKHTVGIGGGFYQSKHVPETVLGAFSPPTFDQTALGAYAYYALSDRAGTMPFRLEVSAGLIESLLDTFRSARHFLQTPWLRPAFTLQYTSWASLRFSYRLAFQNFIDGNLEGTSEDRDGNEHIFQLDNFFSVGKRLDIRFGLTAGLFGADGDQWDATFTGLAADLRVRVLSGFDLLFGFDYLHRDFRNSSYAVVGRDLTQTRTVQRVDDRVTAYGRVRLGTELFAVSLLYTFVRNVSSASQLFGYDRHIGGLEVMFTF